MVNQPPARVSRFSYRLLAEWRRLSLPESGATVIVGVSGGADSTALLLALHELTVGGRLPLLLVAAHVNHNLRGDESDADALWVAALAARLDVPLRSIGVSLDGVRDNLEQAARRARYEFFGEAARQCDAALVLVAHTVDDQAETVLLNLLRGGAAEGLGGMRAVRPLGETGETRISVARPLLGWARRRDTEDYCRARGADFRRDAMNDDERFARVRVRRQLIPLLRTFNPRVVETLVRGANLLRDDGDALDESAKALLERSGAKDATGECADAPDASAAPAAPSVLSVRVLRAAPAAIRRRALRQWIAAHAGHLRRIEAGHVAALEKLLQGERGGRTVELPGGLEVKRRRQEIRLVIKKFVK